MALEERIEKLIATAARNEANITAILNSQEELKKNLRETCALKHAPIEMHLQAAKDFRLLVWGGIISIVGATALNIAMFMIQHFGR